ncbi:hypothetical protein L249_7000 [Ophiocordyceps polyrhachis-furcata BCC 54312]|uniref:Uncharacterized protein n=1 Tax=Ophiocordyceps polyrhachis-furcata BCC 54312 TaxID=1330021 RepID=A0A367LLL0_9HYPO|nr:hypothetical protein L249_7000 [Ophiocordyceps polyrhachis-furcata BCC 54312]
MMDRYFKRLFLGFCRCNCSSSSSSSAHIDIQLYLSFKMPPRRLSSLFASITTLASLCCGELVQRWKILDRQPHWHRFAGTIYRPVLYPEHDVILQYNCYWMPAICRNAKNWMENTTKSVWDSREANDTFSYDLLATTRSYYQRRWDSCPYTWSDWPKAVSRCPEKDQPRVMPGPWIHEGLERAKPKVSMEIESTANATYAANLVHDPGRSGRQYACDEFPPASWVEGGSGPGNRSRAAESDWIGSPANTYCVPQMVSPDCAETYAGIHSERDWQATADRMLRARLLQQTVPTSGGSYQTHENDCVRFRLELVDDPDIGPSRVLWKPGTEAGKNHWRQRLSRTKAELESREGYVYDEIVLNVSQRYEPIINLAQTFYPSTTSRALQDGKRVEEKHDACLPRSPYATHPNQTANRVECFKLGWPAFREDIVPSIDMFCQGAAGTALDFRTKPSFVGKIMVDLFHLFDTKIYISVHLKEGCEYRIREEECRLTLMDMVNVCAAKGFFGGKTGGMIENNCLKWIIDPELL